jgi:hypothetical protein
MEQHTGHKGVITTMKIARDVDAGKAFWMKDGREVDDLYVELDEGAIPDGILDYEDGIGARHPTPEAYTIALGFAAQCASSTTWVASSALFKTCARSNIGAAHQSGQHDNGCRRPPHSWART